jgi:replicative DNA helicase
VLSGQDPLEEAAELLTLAENITRGNYEAGVVSTKDAAMELLDDLERVDSGYQPLVESGFRELDRTLGGGFIREGLYILAARPGLRKDDPGNGHRGANAGAGQAGAVREP